MLAHQIPVILGGEIDPLVIFAEMPGAWLEPRIGRMWQENTGTTPTNTAGQSIGKINDLSGYGYNATQATLANRPTLQYANGLPIVSCDSNDFMTVSLPAINVRRNLLTYSEMFENAAWIKDAVTVTANAALAPNGTQTADLLIPSVVNTYHGLYCQGLPNSGVYGGYTLYAKSSGYNKIRVWNGAGPSQAVDIDLQTAQITNTGGSVISATVTLLDNGWVEIKFVELISVYFYITVLREADGAYVQFEGDGVSGIYIWGAQLEFGSVATNYQKITDWTSEQFSSSGSVYFALSTGMSALHNQSIGTSYSAPIQSMDLYGAMIVPSRLSDQREAQLQIYFEKLAGLR